MKLTSYFKHFLENTVNLNQARIDQLDQRVDAITTFLTEHPELGSIVIELIPQGSYAHKTIIKPVNGRDFDADVLLYVHEQGDWEPKDYVAKLYAAFRGSATYSGMVDRKTRCVTVDYANDFHIDVVPYLERGNSRYVTNRHQNRFELTNPEGFNEWLDDRNRDREQPPGRGDPARQVPARLQGHVLDQVGHPHHPAGRPGQPGPPPWRSELLQRHADHPAARDYRSRPLPPGEPDHAHHRRPQPHRRELQRPLGSGWLQQLPREDPLLRRQDRRGLPRARQDHQPQALAGRLRRRLHGAAGDAGAENSPASR